VTLGYIVRRVLLFVLVLWAATTFIFFLPRLARDGTILSMAERRGNLTSSGDGQGLQNFGLTSPPHPVSALWRRDPTGLQLLLAFYPSRVIGLIGQALPWTIGLLLTSTILAFTTGTLLWADGLATRAEGFLLPPRSPSAIPYYLLTAAGLCLVVQGQDLSD
jgi:peptide/nickel transport system permease protein